MTNDPIALIKEDHTTVEALFKKYEALGDKAETSKRKIADQVITELTDHAEMEETLCYPIFKDAFNNEEDKMVDEAYVEHQGAKDLLEKLKTLDSAMPEFDAHMKVLMEQIRHHVKEEEGELLPTAQKEISEERLEDMGAKMVAFKAERA